MPKRVKKAKRAGDVNQMAHALVQQIAAATEDAERARVTPDELSRVMAMLGRAGGKKGGKRRLVTMTPEQRSDIALKAARARWAKAAKKKR